MTSEANGEAMSEKKSTEIVPVNQKAENVRLLLEKAKPQIRMALPKHLDADRMLRIAMTSVRRTPALLSCNQQSLLGAVMQAAQLGLEPDGVLGHAYLIPFKDEVQLIVGYKGLVDLARRSGQLSTIFSRVVYAKDQFEFAYGLTERLEHIPSEAEDPGDIVAVYAVARLKDGGTQFEVMRRREVDEIRKRSRAGTSGPWVSDFAEMSRKTVIRRLCKMLPASVELARAVALDERADVGLSQQLEDVIDVPVEAGRKPTLDDVTAMEGGAA
jgi:recombination protein RecT